MVKWGGHNGHANPQQNFGTPNPMKTNVIKAQSSNFDSRDMNPESKKTPQLPYFDVPSGGLSALRAVPAKHAAIKCALHLKLAEFSYRSVLPSFSGKSLLKWRFEEQNPRIASAKIIDTTRISTTICQRMKVKRTDMKILSILNPKYTWLLHVLRGQHAGHSFRRTRHQKIPVEVFFLIPDSCEFYRSN